MPRYRRTGGGDLKAWPKTFLKARRVGGSFAAAVDAANMAAGYEWDGARWVNAKPFDVHVVSASFNQAKNVLAEVADFVEKVGGFDSRYRAKIGIEAIEFETGAKIIAHPAKPASLRTWTGGLLLDEIAFVQRLEDVWAAAKNIASATLKEPRGYPVSMITTPWAHGSFAHRLFNDEAFGFQRLKVDIYDAKRDGLPIDIEQTRAESALAEIFATEFECQWLRGGSCFFDPDLLLAAERDEDLPESLASEPSFYGIDIGRTSDLTVIVECKRLGDVIWIVGITALRDWHFDDQRDTVIATLGDRSKKLGRCLIDRGGMGRDLADHLERRFATRCKGVDFSLDSKEEMATRFKQALQGGRIRFWTGGDADQMRALRVELTTIKTRATASGRLGFETPRTVTGHGDRAWAAMLALAAVNATSVANTGGAMKPFVGGSAPGIAGWG